jgi:hypothetical protein
VNGKRGVERSHARLPTRLWSIVKSDSVLVIERDGAKRYRRVCRFDEETCVVEIFVWEKTRRRHKSENGDV